MIRNTLFDRKFSQNVAKHIKKVGTIADIGPGIRPFNLFKAKHLCIEPYDEYVEELSKNGYTVMQGTAERVLSIIEPVESIFLLDVIEHMEKDTGRRVLKLAIEKSTVQVVVFTPLGYMPQDPKDIDPWGYYGMEWQTHRSGWEPDDFPGWRTFVDKRFFREHGALFAIFNHPPVLE